MDDDESLAPPDSLRLDAAQLDALSKMSSSLCSVARSLNNRTLGLPLVPIREEELARLSLAAALAQPGEPELGVALGMAKLLAFQDYLEFLSWFVNDFHPMLTRRIELAQAGEPVVRLGDGELRDAIAQRDAEEIVASLDFYLKARKAFASQHMGADDAMLQALDLERAMFPAWWMDPELWDALLGIFEVDLEELLPALPAQAD